MPDYKFISFLKTLKPEDWSKKASSKWTIKDVVAHMIGWEKGDVEAIRTTWKTKKPPWWTNTDNYEEFNLIALEEYKDYTPEQLIAEWEKWQKKVQAEIDIIGEENLRSRPELFAWLFEGVDDFRRNGTKSHYKYHYDQIKEAIREE